MLAALLFLFVLLPALVFAAPPASANSKVLNVGVYEAPPFCIHTAEGEWRGVSVELWKRIAKQLGFEYRWREYTLEELLKAVANGDIDVAVGPIALTRDRETIMDFSHPYYVSDLAIAVSPQTNFYPWSEVAKEFFNIAWLRLIIVLLIMLALSSICVWHFERKRNHAQFGGGWHHGLGSSFWWAAVTMSGVGYGDKAPITLGGRVIALLWIFISVITVSLVTASVTSGVVANRITTKIHSPSDLSGARVAVVNGSTAEKYCLLARINYNLYPEIDSCLQAVTSREVDACIGDEASLGFAAKQLKDEHLRLLPFRFQQNDCCFALPPGSPLQEPINRVLLDEIRSDEWHKLRMQYLGL